MKSNISSVLFLCALSLWITYCNAVSVKDGNYLKSDPVKKINSDYVEFENVVKIKVQEIQHGHQSISENGKLFEKVLHFAQNSRQVKNKDGHYVAENVWNVFGGRGNHALKDSPRTTRGQGRKVFLTKSDGEEYDDSILTNKDLVTRTRQKSIPPPQFTRTSGHKDVKDLTFLYGRDPMRDTYRNRYHETKAKDAPKSAWSSSAGRKSFDGLSGHYKSRGSGRVIDGGRGLKRDNETYYNAVPAAFTENFISRKKRSDSESRHERQSDLDNLTLSTSHSDHGSWPDKTSRSDNRITVSPFVNTNAVLPVVSTVNIVPETTESSFKGTTISLPSTQPDRDSSTTESLAVVIPDSTIKTIPVESILSSSSNTKVKDSTTESQSLQVTTETFQPQTSQSVPPNTVSVSDSSDHVSQSPAEASTKERNVIPSVDTAKTSSGTTSALFRDGGETTISHLLDTSTKFRDLITSVSEKSNTVSSEMTSLKSENIAPGNALATETTIPVMPTTIIPQANSTLKDETIDLVTATKEHIPIPEPEMSSEPTSQPSEKLSVLVSELPTVTSPKPTPETSSHPNTAAPSPEPSTKSSSEPASVKSSVLTHVLSTKHTTKTSPEPTTEMESETPLVSSPEPTSSSGMSTTKTSPEPTNLTSAEPTTEKSPETTTKLLSIAKVTEKENSYSHPKFTSEPQPTSEPFMNSEPEIPIIFIPEADETIADEITKISDTSNSSTSRNMSEQTSNMTELSPTIGDTQSTLSETLPSSTSSQTPDSEPLPTPTSPMGEPLPTPTSPTGEPVSTPTSESEPPSSAEPESEPEGETPSSTPSPIAEPGPDWEDAKKKWSIAWEIHLYMLGGIFAAISFYTLMSMVKLYQINRLLSKKYFITLNLLIFILCTLRSVFLLVDGYNANKTFHPVVNYLLYSTAFPCLTSAFSILLYALLQATQMRLVPPRVQKIQILMVVIFFHFVLQITTDVLVGTYAGMNIMLFVCQMVFICWGLFLFFGYAYIFRYLYTSAVKRQKNYQYMLTGKLYPSGGESYKHKFTLSLAVKVTFMAAILGLVTIGLEIYAIVGVYGVFSDKKPEAWPWWLYHTALRLVECLMCIIMAYVASQPFRYKEMKSCGFMCAPCLEICKCGGKDEQSDKLGWSEYDRLYMTTNKRSNGHTNGKKKKIYLNEGTDIVPIVIQPSTTEESRPPSMLIIEDGYVRFQAETDINKIVDNYSKAHGTEMTTFKNYDGIVNGAYIRSMEDTVRFQDDIVSSDGFTRKSRKSSLASSGFFRPPSSISLADSMESEIDKAFRSMRQDSTSKLRASTHSLPSRSTYSIDENFQGPAIEAYIEQVANEPGVILRRSRSALGDLNIHRPESWRQKLFRSRSDSSGGVRTKDLDSMRYLSLLDLEKQQEKNVSFASGTAMSKDSDNSDDSYVDNHQSRDTRTSNRDVVKRLLQKEISEPEEIDV